MTKKKSDKRRIEIDDKRARDENGGSGDPVSELEVEARQALGNLDEALLEFTTAGQATRGQAAMAEEALRGYQAAQPAAPAADVPASAPGAEAVTEPTPAELRDQVLRKEAELQNYRKRVQKDMQYARQSAVEGLLADLFPAFDGLAQAAATFKDKAEGEDPLLDGVRRTVAVLDKALAKHGIEKINAAPVPFDPELHQVLNLETSSAVEVETVAEVYVEGYRLGETVLKPAMVHVLKPEE